MSYQIKLNVFEGPYDLLLFLVRKNEIDIYDIPIARITREYLEYVEMMRALDLNVAGEFIVVAATLMRIKSKMLLPVHVEEDEEDLEDPRRELVESLLEYQRMKHAARSIEALELRQRDRFARGNVEKESKAAEAPDEDFELQMTVYELVVAYNQMLQREKRSFHYVDPDPVSIEEQIDRIVELLRERKRFCFQEYLMRVADTIVIVINFLAILELAKRKQIKIAQSGPNADIWIYRVYETGSDRRA